mmetsp:Transcript_62478/g.136759  ORF Transcript_62478/g.136759 Transcript_62478/m.136759 type:complete len:201 (-) Transcript_62478:1644-2246(-)
MLACLWSAAGCETGRSNFSLTLRAQLRLMASARCDLHCFLEASCSSPKAACCNAELVHDHADTNKPMPVSAGLHLQAGSLPSQPCLQGQALNLGIGEKLRLCQHGAWAQQGSIHSSSTWLQPPRGQPPPHLHDLAVLVQHPQDLFSPHLLLTSFPPCCSCPSSSAPGDGCQSPEPRKPTWRALIQQRLAPRTHRGNLRWG